MAIQVLLETAKQILIRDVATSEFLGNVYAPNITSFAKLIRRFYPNDQGLVPSRVYVGNGYETSPSKEQYIVRMHLNNGMYEDIPLGGDGLPEEWTNDEEGYYAAVGAITSWANS